MTPTPTLTPTFTNTDTPTNTPTPTITPTPTATPTQNPMDNGGGNPGKCDMNKMSSHHVNLRTGNLFHQVTDLFIPNRGVPLRITRSYNSFAHIDGVFGLKWSSIFDENMSSQQDGSIRYLREDGAVRVFQPNGAGGFLSPPGYDVTLTKTSSEYVLQFPNGDTRHYAIVGNFNFLTRLADRNGSFVDVFHLASSDVIRDNNGRVVTLYLDYIGHADHLVDPIGRTTMYTVDSSINLINVSYPGGRTAIYAYNPGSFMSESQDPAYHKGAHHLFYTYSTDGLNMITDEKNELGKSLLHIVSYNGAYYNNTQTVFTEPGGCSSCSGGGGGGTYNFDLNTGLFTGGLDAGGNSFTYGHDTDFNRTSSLDANNHPTSMTYDTNGNLLTQRDALGHSVTYTYEPNFNQPTTFTDANGNSTVYSYDNNGNPTKVIAGFGTSQAQTTINTYDPNTGDRLSTTDANGKTTQFHYDPYGNLNTATDPDGHVTTYTYDNAGRLQTVQDAKRNPPTQYTWDDADRLTKVQFPDGSFALYTYDVNGNRKTMTDSNENTTTYDYDERDGVTLITDANLHTTQYAYDTAENPKTITDGNNHQTIFTYDDLNRLTSVTDPLNRATTYTYDPVGNLQTRKDGNGNLTTYKYDAVNRPTTVIYQDGSMVINSYDSVGNLTQRQEPAGTSTFQYDAINRLTDKTDAFGNHVGFQYDPAGNLVRLRYPNNKSVTYAYSPENQPVNVGSPNGAFAPFSATYDANLNWKTLTYPNGVLETSDYDPRNQLQHITRTGIAAGTLTIPNVAYNYDPAGNRVNQALNTSISNYGYDFTNQLTSAAVSLPGLTPLQQVYSYDGAGNRTRFQQNHDVTVYSYNEANELTSKTFNQNVAMWVPYERYAAAGVNDGGVQFQSLGAVKNGNGRVTTTFTTTPTFTNTPTRPGSNSKIPSKAKKSPTAHPTGTITLTTTVTPGTPAASLTPNFTPTPTSIENFDVLRNPRDLSCSAGDSDVVLNWLAPAIGVFRNPDGYRIYRSPVAGGPYAQVGILPMNSASESNQTVSTTDDPPEGDWYYVVKAYRNNPISESDASNECGAEAVWRNSPTPTWTATPTPSPSFTSTLSSTFSPTPTPSLASALSSTFTPTFTPTPSATRNIPIHNPHHDPCMDSGDAFDNSGAVPVTLLSLLATLGTPCGNSKWVSGTASGGSNGGGNPIFARTFSIKDQGTISTGVFTLSFAGSPLVVVIVNNSVIASTGLGCDVLAIPSNVLQVGQNTIAFVPQLNGGTGGLSYEFCGPFTTTLGATPTITLTGTSTPTGSSTPTPTGSFTATPTATCSATTTIFLDDFSTTASLSNYDLFFVDGTPASNGNSGYQVANGFLEDLAPVNGDVGGQAIVKDSVLAHSLSNYTVEADCEMDARTNGFGVFGLVFRSQNGGNFISFQYNGNPEHQPPVWQVEKVGVGSLVSSAAATAYSFGSTVHMKVVCQGNEFKCYVNMGSGDQLIYDVFDTVGTPFASGGVGTRTNSIMYPNVVRFDNLKVSGCPPGPVPTNTSTPTITPTPTITFTPTFTITFTPTISPTPKRAPQVTTYSYDNNGNLTKEVSGGVTTVYTYDFENRLKQITYNAGTSGATVETFVYNYAGELLRRTTAQGRINYVYGQGVAPVAEISNFGSTPETDFIQINGKTVGAVGSGQNGRTKSTLYYHTDGLGSVLGITDSTATVVENQLFDPFGVSLSLGGNLNNSYQFVGAYGVRHDPAPGNTSQMTFDHSIMGVRMYDASVGRFISQDPLGRNGNYLYVGDSPIGRIDPRGLFQWYGNYGGPDWTGGLVETYHPEHDQYYSPPIDNQDSCYRRHDICYYHCRAAYSCNCKLARTCFRICDRSLSSQLQNLGNDPSNDWHAKFAAQYFSSSEPDCDKSSSNAPN